MGFINKEISLLNLLVDFYILMLVLISFAAFISLVILRYCRQHLGPKLEEGEAEEGEQGQQQQQALVVVGEGCPK